MVEHSSLLCNFDARVVLWLCIKLETFTLIEVNFSHLFAKNVLKHSGMEDPVEGFGSFWSCLCFFIPS